MFYLIGFGWFIIVRIILSNSPFIILFCVAGVRPGSRGPFVSAKVPKTSDAQSGLMSGDGRKTQEGEPTRGACPESYRRAQTRLAGPRERPSRGPDSRRRILEDEHFA